MARIDGDTLYIRDDEEVEVVCETEFGTRTIRDYLGKFVSGVWKKKRTPKIKEGEKEKPS